MLSPHRHQLYKESAVYSQYYKPSQLTSEIPDQLQACITSGGDLAQSTGVLPEPQSLRLGHLLLVRHADQSLLESDRERDKLVSRVVLVDPSFDFGQPLVLFADKVTLGQVDEVGDRLGGEKCQAVDDLDL